MELFSKRYSETTLKRLSSLIDNDNIELFLSHELRNRLVEEIKYVVKSTKYLEPFLILTKHDERFLHEASLKDIGLRELGYNFLNYFDCDSLNFRYDREDDTRLLDLIELFIIFSTSTNRTELVKRFGKILKEEKSFFMINDCIISEKDPSDLNALIPLIKEKNLQKKLIEFYSIEKSASWESMASISADILQLIFSSPVNKDDTKKFSENTCSLIAKKWTSDDNVENLDSLLNETVKNAKKMNNEISNIRHSDRTTILTDNSNFYKLIATRNMSIVELVILSLIENYIIKEDPEEIKNNYLSQYGINKNIGWIIENNTTFENIPF